MLTIQQLAALSIPMYGTTEVAGSQTLPSTRVPSSTGIKRSRTVQTTVNTELAIEICASSRHCAGGGVDDRRTCGTNTIGMDMISIEIGPRSVLAPRRTPATSTPAIVVTTRIVAALESATVA